MRESFLQKFARPFQNIGYARLQHLRRKTPLEQQRCIQLKKKSVFGNSRSNRDRQILRRVNMREQG